MFQANPMPTPMAIGVKLSSQTGDPSEELTLYRSTVGEI